MILRKNQNRCESTSRISTKQLLLSFLTVATSMKLVASTKPTGILTNPQQTVLQPSLPLQAAERPNADSYSPRPLKHEFTLRHVFDNDLSGKVDGSRRLDARLKEDRTHLRASDIHEDELPTLFVAQSTTSLIERMVDRSSENIQDLLQEAQYFKRPAILDASAWTTDDVLVPDVKDKDTVLALAYMAANAYRQPDMANWDWVDQNGFNFSNSFGWNNYSLQGHVFATPENDTIVIAIKGTSTAAFDGAETTTPDKENDNLFFSCCCAQQGHYLWRSVCDCATSTFTCNETCVYQALLGKNRYYQASLDLYGNVTQLYPNSNVWLTGHSLGGAVSSFLGLTYGLPAVTYQSPGNLIPAQRLGLPSPPSAIGFAKNRKYAGVWNFGQNADPIYQGTCNGATAGCTLFGYALETGCHVGQTCTYDTVGDLGYRQTVLNHRIDSVIKDVILKYPEAAECETDNECVDCFNWKHYYSNGSETTTTSASLTTSTSMTRTETCKTPGWWGCLDKTTTLTSTTTTTTSSTTTTIATCSRYGWFGQCLDPITTTTSSFSSSSLLSSTPSITPTPTSNSSTTTTCLTPGVIFGCRDKTSTSTSIAVSTTSSVSSTTCLTPGLIYGCKDRAADSTDPAKAMVTATPNLG
ncbi:putative lipase atg15 [Agyrium rufum]|nr:putative lipase atg15 [Agyrium rufum]